MSEFLADCRAVLLWFVMNTRTGQNKMLYRQVGFCLKTDRLNRCRSLVHRAYRGAWNCDRQHVLLYWFMAHYTTTLLILSLSLSLSFFLYLTLTVFLMKLVEVIFCTLTPSRNRC